MTGVARRVLMEVGSSHTGPLAQKNRSVTHMKATLSKDGKSLLIEMPLISPPKTSASGKTLIVATTGGNKETEIKVNGKSVIVGCNAYIYATDKASEKKGEE